MSEPLIKIEHAGPSGMITFRADLSDPGVSSALAFSGLEVPARRQVTSGGGPEVLWMSPDELMILTSHGETDALIATLTEAMAGQHFLAVNVSDARVMFRLTGSDAHLREVLAKLSPADLRATSLPQGEVRRTRLAQVPAAFWFSRDGEAMLIAFRSVGDYVEGLLKKVSEPGSAVGYF